MKPYKDLQYKLIQQGATFAAMSSKLVKAAKTVMQWHKTLNYYGSEVIEQLKKKENITIINKTKDPKTYKYETYTLSKSK